MTRILAFAAPIALAASPAFAGFAVEPTPGPGLLGLAAAGVVGAIYLARRKR
jgi:hypothetical protein